MAKKCKAKNFNLKEFTHEIEEPVAMISIGLRKYDHRIRGGILTLLMILWLKDLHPRDRRKIVAGLCDMINEEFEGEEHGSAADEKR